MKRVDSVHTKTSSIAELDKKLDDFWLIDPAPFHEHYKLHFNLIDLADRYWYKAYEGHRNLHWRSKMLFGLMRLVTINVWGFVTGVKYHKWQDFRIKLAQELMEYEL